MQPIDRYFEHKYPGLFRDLRGSMNQTCMYWGCAVGPGWWPLIDAQSAEIIEAGIDCKYEQIKEKFGLLRVYTQEYSTTSLQNTKLYDIIDKYEAISEHICEECGRFGKRRSSGWIKVTCEEHNK